MIGQVLQNHDARAMILNEICVLLEVTVYGISYY